MPTTWPLQVCKNDGSLKSIKNNGSYKKVTSTGATDAYAM